MNGSSEQELLHRSTLFDMYFTGWSSHWRRYISKTEYMIGWHNTATSPKFRFLNLHLSEPLKLSCCCKSPKSCRRTSDWIWDGNKFDFTLKMATPDVQIVFCVNGALNICNATLPISFIANYLWNMFPAISEWTLYCGTLVVKHWFRKKELV